jgi:hypothetical protein
MHGGRRSAADGTVHAIVGREATHGPLPRPLRQIVTLQPPPRASLLPAQPFQPPQTIARTPSIGRKVAGEFTGVAIRRSDAP